MVLLLNVTCLDLHALDECHIDNFEAYVCLQVGDQSRGYLLELLLTKLRYASGEGNSESSSGESSGTSSKGDPAHGLQIVGMSATMPNVAAVADWLQVSGIMRRFSNQAELFIVWLFQPWVG